MSYHWDAEEIDWAGVDALEIAGCADLGDAVERVEDADEADLFSVYVHRPGEGAECIADRDTLEAAVALAERLAADRGGLTVHHFY